MLFANEMVMETSGIMKPLQEFIKNAGSSSTSWEEYGGSSALVWANATDMPDEITSAIDGEVDYTDIIIKYHDTTGKFVVNICDTWDNFVALVKEKGAYPFMVRNVAGNSYMATFELLEKSSGKYQFKIAVPSSSLNANVVKIYFNVK